MRVLRILAVSLLFVITGIGIVGGCGGGGGGLGLVDPPPEHETVGIDKASRAARIRGRECIADFYSTEVAILRRAGPFRQRQ